MGHRDSGHRTPQDFRQWNCAKGDYGNPVEYLVQGLQDGLKVIQTSTVKITDDSQVSPLANLAKRAREVWKVRATLPRAEREMVEEQLPEAFRSLFTAEPNQRLSFGDQMVVKENLERLRKILQKKLT